jgi:hypothetical protein
MLPKFLVIRFAPGAAGNMLTSMIQCSPEVAHWDEQQESIKPNNNWLAYFESCFPREINKWLYYEPIGQLNWGTRNIFSAKYPRGNNFTVDEFLEQEKIYCNQYYHQQKNQKKYLPVFWHKEIMPEYFINSKSICIELDQPALRWYNHAVYKKHYRIINLSRDKRCTVEILQNRPQIVLPQYRGQVEYTKTFDSFRQFVNQCIVQNPFQMMFRQANQLPAWPIDNLQLTLSTLLDTEKFLKKYFEICEFLEITPVLTKSVFSQMHNYWKNLHEF